MRVNPTIGDVEQWGVWFNIDPIGGITLGTDMVFHDSL